MWLLGCHGDRGRLDVHARDGEAEVVDLGIRRGGDAIGVGLKEKVRCVCVRERERESVIQFEFESEEISPGKYRGAA